LARLPLSFHPPFPVRPIRIDRCICSKVPFTELKEAADQKGARTLEELQQVREFGVNCRLCHPYVRCMLRDGRTVFDEILREEP
jgi:bacterioferritin-associated ferredoxin